MFYFVLICLFGVAKQNSDMMIYDFMCRISNNIDKVPELQKEARVYMIAYNRATLKLPETTFFSTMKVIFRPFVFGECTPCDIEDLQSHFMYHNIDGVYVIPNFCLADTI
ncbi:hypothetical protein RF11_05061 [Thelohanellus kitauei]|uniref:Uncharacterized protein n=1 Tax=Thelohanellus kitauei TaxID=669202 RepID=A0A0C2NJZ6_THEKT|nr:hypothetical protein RF11_05061 [Thelohanellus kitauei]